MTQKTGFVHVIDAANYNPLLFHSIRCSNRSIFDYTVICLGPTGPLQKQMEELGVPFFAYGNNSRKKAFRNWLRLYRFFRRHKPRIVQTHLFDSSLIGLSAAWMARVPVRVFTGHHSHEVPLYRNRKLTFVDSISGRFLSNHTIAPSTDMKEIFIRCHKLPAEKIDVIPHGFDISGMQSNSGKALEIRRELGVEGRIVFGAAGRFFWVKDMERLIDAFSAFATCHSEVVLIIAGEGEDREKMKQRIKMLGMEGRIIFAGRRNDMAAFMDSLDVFVHAAIAESFGMVFIEAFAMGKPVVSTSVGVAPDIIKNWVNGFLVPIQDTRAMTMALENILKMRDQWPAMGKKNRQISVSYDVRKTQALCDSYYLKWLNKK